MIRFSRRYSSALPGQRPGRFLTTQACEMFSGTVFRARVHDVCAGLPRGWTSLEPLGWVSENYEEMYPKLLTKARPSCLRPKFAAEEGKFPACSLFTGVGALELGFSEPPGTPNPVARETKVALPCPAGLQLGVTRASHRRKATSTAAACFGGVWKMVSCPTARLSMTCRSSTASGLLLPVLWRSEEASPARPPCTGAFLSVAPGYQRCRQGPRPR